LTASLYVFDANSADKRSNLIAIAHRLSFDQLAGFNAFWLCVAQVNSLALALSQIKNLR
jgi:hypothetical protein